MRVNELKPGDVIHLPGEDGTATFIIAHSPHPLYPHLWLVIWRLSNGTYSFDALAWNQDVGERVGGGTASLRSALGIQS